MMKKRTTIIALVCALTLTQSWTLPAMAENTDAAQSLYTEDYSVTDAKTEEDISEAEAEDSEQPEPEEDTESDTAAGDTVEAEAESVKETEQEEKIDTETNEITEMVIAEEYGDFTYGTDGTITGYTGSGGSIEIPSEINGVSIVKIADKAFYQNKTITSVNIPETVTEIGKNAFFQCTALVGINIPGTVKKIEENAFNGCKSLTELTLNEGTEYIGTYAFRNCTALEEVTIPSSVTTGGTSWFGGCKKLAKVTFAEGTETILASSMKSAEGLTEVVIPETVTEIGDSAFYQCKALVGINIPGTVKKIGDTVFYGCTSLTGITLNTGTEYIGNNAFRNCTALEEVTIPSSVTTGGTSWFNGCTKLTKVTFAEGTETILASSMKSAEGLTEVVIPETVTEIGDSAFYQCKALISINIPKTVKKIGDTVFYGCTSLTGITLNTGTEYIGNNAFQNCTALEEVTIPSSVTTGGTSWFNGCTKLTKVTFADGATKIPDKSLYNSPALSEVKIADTVTSLGQYCFGSCAKLTEITLPAGLTAEGSGYWFTTGTSTKNTTLTKVTVEDGAQGIPANAFANCTALSEVNLANSIGTIANTAFSGCAALTSISLPQGLKTIDYHAFYNCTGLTDVTIPAGVTSSGVTGSLNKGKWFEGCSALTSVEFADGAVTIPEYALYNSPALSEVKIADTVTSLGQYCFGSCAKLTEIILPAGLTAEGSGYWFTTGISNTNTTLTKVTVKDGAQGIPANAFANCTALSEINLANSIGTIANTAFSGCEAITSIALPQGLKTIGYRAFYNCKGLTDIVIPGGVGESVTGVSSNYGRWFEGCSSLKNVTFGEGAEIIPAYALYNNSTVTTLTLPSTLKQIGNYAFYGCSGISSIKLGQLLTTIGDSAFCNCTSLKGVRIPSSLTSATNAFKMSGLTYAIFEDGTECVPEGIFSNASSLTKVVLPSSIKKIEANAFSSCAKLSSIELPDKLTSIGSKAFYYCTSLKKITIPAGIKEINNGVFYGCTFSNITVINPYTVISNLALAAGAVITAPYNSYAAVRALNNTDYTRYTFIPFYPNMSKASEFGITHTVPMFTFSADSFTNDGVITVSGTGTAGDIITIYADGTKAGTLTVLKSGTYRGKVTLPEGADGAISLKASNGTKELTQTVTAGEELPEITSLLFRQNNTDTSLFIEDGIKKNVLFDANAEYSFILTFDNASKVKKLYVVDNKNADAEKIEAVWNEEAQAFVTSESFGEGYIPSDISIEYVVDGSKVSYSTNVEISSPSAAWENAQVVNADGTGATIVLNDTDGRIITFAKSVSAAGLSDAEGYTKVTDSTGKTLYVKTTSNGYDVLTVSVIDLDEGINTAHTVFVNSTADNANASIESLIDTTDSFVLGNGKTVNINAVEAAVLGYSGDIDEQFDAKAQRITAAKTENTAYYLLSTISLFAQDSIDKNTTLNVLKLAISAELDAVGADIDNIATKSSAGAGYGLNYFANITGSVFEGMPTFPLQGVTVTATYKETEDGVGAEFKGAAYEQPDMVTTDANGQFLWKLPAGYYIFHYSLDGYADAESVDWIHLTASDDASVSNSMTALEQTTVENIEIYEQYAVVEFSKSVRQSTISSYNSLRLMSQQGYVSYNIKALDGVTGYYGDSYDTVASKYILAFSNNYEAVPGRTYTVNITSGITNYANIPVVEKNESVICKSGGVKLMVPTEASIFLGETYNLNYMVSAPEDADVTVSFNKSYGSNVVNVSEAEAYNKTSGRGALQIKSSSGSIGTDYITLSIPEYGITKNFEVNVLVPPQDSDILVRNTYINSTEKTIAFDFYNTTSSAQSFKGICAIYSDKGELIELKVADIEDLNAKKSEYVSMEFSTGGWYSYKIFAWDSFDTMKPLRITK